MRGVWMAAVLGVLGAGACEADPGPQTAQVEQGDARVEVATANAQVDEPEAGPIKLRIPINSVMAGVVNRASFEIFQAATRQDALTEHDWLQLGASAIDLVGAATLTTLPGTGENDEAWVADPEWLEFSIEMRDAGMAVGRAAALQDGAALSEASARLAQSCQSCHLVFSPRLVTSTTP